MGPDFNRRERKDHKESFLFAERIARNVQNVPALFGYGWLRYVHSSAVHSPDDHSPALIPDSVVTALP